MTATVYTPKISIKIYALTARKIISDGLEANERMSKYQVFDIDQMLGDGGSVSVNKNVKQAAGTFDITLTDDMPKSDGVSTFESIYGQVEPMDAVEIRMAHNPTSAMNGKLPIIMRGFVTEVSRNETIGNDGVPVRTVTIAGHDYGKIFQVFRLYSYDNSVQGAPDSLDGWAFSLRYWKGLADNAPATTFIPTYVVPIVQNWLKSMEWKNEKVKNPFVKITAQSTPEGLVQVKLLNDIQEGVSLYELISRVCDVSSGFNEFFVEDEEEETKVILRPTPVFMPDGELAKPSDKETDYFPDDVEITTDDIVAITVSRSDSNVANYFWVDQPTAMLETDQMWQTMMREPAEKDYQNNSYTRFGVREMRQTVSLYPPADYQDWFNKHIDVLKKIGRNAVIFESGTLRLIGNENIKAGGILKITRGNLESQCYIEQVTHEFQPYFGYTTTVRFSFGTGFASRAQADKPYLDELAKTNPVDKQKTYDVHFYNDKGEEFTSTETSTESSGGSFKSINKVKKQ